MEPTYWFVHGLGGKHMVSNSTYPWQYYSSSRCSHSHSTYSKLPHAHVSAEAMEC